MIGIEFETGLIADLIMRGLILMAVVFLLTRLFRRSAAAWRHAFWVGALIVLLFLPLTILGETSVTLFEREAETEVAMIETPALTSLGEVAAIETTEAESSRPVNAHRSSAGPKLEAPEAPPVLEAAKELSGIESSLGGAVDPGLRLPGLSTILLLVWSAGLLVLAWRWSRASRALRRLEAGGLRADLELLGLVRRCCRQVGLRSSPRVVVIEGLDSPSVCGLLRGRLFIPAGLSRELRSDLLEPLLLHELLHLRRRDPMVQVLVRLTATLNWFNPFVWIAGREIERDRELLTDAAVVALDGRRADYAEGLLSVLKRGAGGRSPDLVLGLGDGDSVRDRLTRLLNGETVRRERRVFGLTSLLLCLFMALTLSRFGLVGVAAASPAPVSDRVDLSDEDAPASVIQDEESVVATIRVRIVASAVERARGIYRVKKKTLGVPKMAELLSRYSVDADPKYDDGNGLSSTRVIIEVPADGLEDDIKPVLLASSNAKIYRVEIDRKSASPALPGELEKTAAERFESDVWKTIQEAKLIRDSAQAIPRALDWLASVQDGEGAIDDGSGLESHAVGRTALALLAFLGAGETHKAGPYMKIVDRARQFILAAQDEKGFFGKKNDPTTVYDHAIAALAITELHAMTKDSSLKGPVRGAIAWTLAAQNPYKAWRYGIRDGDNDTSITTWQLMFLSSAKVSGFEVPEQSFQCGSDFLNEMTDPETGRIGYTRRGGMLDRARRTEHLGPVPDPRVETMTAAGSFARVLCGLDPKTEILAKGRALMLAAPPIWKPEEKRVCMVYWYFGTLTSFQAGGEHWQRWSKAMRLALVGNQVEEGPGAGSWDPVGIWGKEGGRVYSTALATLALEVSYRDARVSGTSKKPR